LFTNYTERVRRDNVIAGVDLDGNPRRTRVKGSTCTKRVTKRTGDIIPGRGNRVGHR